MKGSASGDLSLRPDALENLAAPLREAWYYAAPGSRLRCGAMLARVMLGEPILLGRDAAGEVFALIYYAIFAAIDTSGWLVGASFGLLHGVVSATALVNVLLPVVHPRMGSTLSAADSAPLLEPPGFLMRNYGRGTPIATVLAHIAYGAIVGGLASIAA